MAPMVEADRDGRLDAREQASLARHLATCASCRQLATDLARMGELSTRRILPEATTLERQRGRAALLQKAAVGVAGGPAKGRLRLPGPNPLAMALAGAATVVIAVSVGIRERGTSPTISLARKLPPPPALVAAETTVQGSAGARFTRTRTGSVERVELDDGAIDLHVRPLGANERFLVVTGDAEVEVRGTVFHVEARTRHITAVSVSEGKVEVRYAGTITLLESGQSWRAGNDEVPLSMGNPVGVPQTPPVNKRPAEIPKPPALVSEAPKAPAEASSSAFAEGMRLIERGDYAAGAERLGAYERERPGDPRAEDAAFLSILALQRAGRRDEARAAARRYLAKYPNGYRRAEVDRIAR